MRNYMRHFNPIIFFASFLCACTNNTPKERSDIKNQIAIEPNMIIERLFVQWQYPNEMDILKALDIRHNLENEIDEVLKLKNLGEWIAGDMGPGGANMEYRIKSSPNEAIKTILDILVKEGLENECVIATDIDFLSGKWTYKILYPKGYNRKFDPS